MYSEVLYVSVPANTFAPSHSILPVQLNRAVSTFNFLATSLFLPSTFSRSLQRDLPDAEEPGY